jgi:pimeloyl-ACP methyl ester carboxylesterase
MRRRAILAATLAAIAIPATAQVERDPPIDRAHPASSAGLQFVSNGSLVNAQVYSPAGAGPFPTVILLHGLPGNEQNLDLARAMQRAGWAVITFHYRGSWGSGGRFALTNGCDDVDALIADLSAPANADKWRADPKRLVVIGHSYGGYVASCAANRHPALRAIGLIAPWNIAEDVDDFARLSPEERRTKAPVAFDDIDGRLTGADAQSLMEEIVAGGRQLDLTRFTPALARRPLLLATATRDSADDQAVGLSKALSAKTSLVTRRLFDTDHAFNDQRLALTAFVLGWLGKVPGAPRAVAGRRAG